METAIQTKEQQEGLKTGVFQTLSSINCNDFTEKKEKLTYLSWASAWEIVSKLYADIRYEVTHWDGKPFLYDETLGYMVETSISIEGETKMMWLPVMDNSNRAQKSHDYEVEVKYGEKVVTKKVKAATMFDINTAIMRCLTKNLAMFGLGLYIYRGEDLPQSEIDENTSMLNDAISKVGECKDMEELKSVYMSYPKLADDRRFRAAINAKAKDFE
jgi:hypothetical protein